MKFALFVMAVLFIGYAPAAEAPNGTLASAPPVGSEESRVKIGDSRVKVEGLLGDVESMVPVERMRTRLVFKRCSILFEAGKVVELPVMRSESELAKERDDKERLAKERWVASQPGSPQVLERSKAKVASLLSRFDAVVSRPGSPVIYVHKAFPTGKYGLMPSVLVDDRGAMALATSYYGGAWLFHDSIGVRIAEKNFSSTVLPHGKPQRRVAQAGFIEERCVFDSHSDQELVREISLSKGKKVFISLLRQGGSILGSLTDQQFASFPPIVELTAVEMSAIRDSVELADAFAALAATVK